MSFEVESKIWTEFPGMRLVVVYGNGLDNATLRPDITEALRATEARLRAEWKYPNAQSDPFVGAWRPALKKVGIALGDFPCAIESLCRRVLSGRPIHNINSMVDFYNQVSLEYRSPVGGWDVGGGRQITLRHTRAGEYFMVLGKTEPVFVNADEISYADEQEILTRHFVWRQSERAKITWQTSDFFLISEALPELGLEVARQIETAFATGLRKYFGIAAKTAILDEHVLNGRFVFERADRGSA